MIGKLVVTLLASGSVLAIALGTTPETVMAQESTSKINGSIQIGSGQHAGDLSTINGSINVGSDAVVGHVKTVNGGLHLESRATAAELTTVNGGLNIEEGAHVTGDVHNVNGGLHVGDHGDVSGDLRNVNGGIHVGAAHIGGSVNGVTGDINLGPNAQIDGSLVMQEPNGSHFGFEHIPVVVIGPGTVVRGALKFERKVTLYVSDRATIGAVTGARVLKFSGDHPPLT